MTEKGVFNRLIDSYKNIFGFKLRHKEVFPTKNTEKDHGYIVFQNVSKSFDRKCVLKEINLEIKPGKILGIIGVNGSGKTTLLKLLIGFYKADKGNISFKGESIAKNIRRFGFATQSDSFYGKLTVAENIRYFGELYGLTDEFINTHMENILNLVQLLDAKDVLAENLSTGMKRRLDIACALIHDPSVLILDEPTEDLDPALRVEILKLIKHINKNGTTIIMTSHLLSDAERICDEIAILNDGKIIAHDTPNNLKNILKYEEIILRSYPGKYERLRRTIEKWKDVLGRSYVINNSLVIHVKKGEKILPKLLGLIKRNKEQVVKLYVQKPTLSEVFLKVIKHDEI